jgi:hypothetical protein
MALLLSIIMLAQQSSTVRGADGSVMQVVDLNAPFDEKNGFDGAARLRFATEDALGQVRPGHSYEVTIKDLGKIEYSPVAEPEVADHQTPGASQSFVIATEEAAPATPANDPAPTAEVPDAQQQVQVDPPTAEPTVTVNG